MFSVILLNIYLASSTYGQPTFTAATTTAENCLDDQEDLRLLQRFEQRLDSLEDVLVGLQGTLQGQVKSIASIHRSVVGDVSYPTLTYIIPGNASVGALTLFNNQLFVSRAGSSEQIQVYNATTLKFIDEFTVPRAETTLFGLESCPMDHNCLFVSDYHQQKIYKLNLSTYQGRITATVSNSWAVAEYPLGLSINRAGNILIASESKQIQEFTTNGSLVRQMSDGNLLFQAVELSDGTIAVSRYGPVHGIAVLSTEGEVLRSYGSTTVGSGLQQMNEPLGLYVTKQDLIIVASWGDNRVVAMNSTLFEARTLSLPTHAFGQFNQPQAVWLDESKGQLYIGEWGAPYRVLVFDNVFVLGSV